MENRATRVRSYTAEDASRVAAWWRAHEGAEFPVALLPPVGLVAEDAAGEPVAACWLYLAAGVGVCWLEYPVSRPGLALAEARAAFGLLLRGLEAIALTHDYGVMLAHTLPPIARVLRGFGFEAEERRKVTVGKRLR